MCGSMELRIVEGNANATVEGVPGKFSIKVRLRSSPVIDSVIKWYSLKLEINFDSGKSVAQWWPHL